MILRAKAIDLVKAWHACIGAAADFARRPSVRTMARLRGALASLDALQTPSPP